MSRVITTVDSVVGKVKLIAVDHGVVNPWNELPDFVLTGHDCHTGRQEKIHLAIESGLVSGSKYHVHIVSRKLSVSINILLEQWRSLGGPSIKLDDESVIVYGRAPVRSAFINKLGERYSTVVDVVQALLCDNSILIRGNVRDRSGVRMEQTLDHQIHVVSHSRSEALRGTHEGSISGSMFLGTTQMFLRVWHPDYSVRELVRPEDLRIEIAKKLAEEFPFLGASSTDFLTTIELF